MPSRKSNSRNKKTPNHGSKYHQWFTWFACAIAHMSGKPIAFLLATAAVVIWAATGPFFHYSDTWQLVINTSTTIVTFLMVFLIQNTQNRDTLALQIKLGELILAIHGAKNKLAVAEEMSDEDLERLHEDFCRRADETRAHLTKRQTSTKKQKAA